MQSTGRRASAGVLIALFMAAPARGQASAVSSSAGADTSRHTEIRDAIGDVVRDARLRVMPDLSAATIDVADGKVTFVIRFAPGSSDRAFGASGRSITWVRIELDSDRSPATGLRERNGMGVDFDVLMLAGGTRAAVQRNEPVRCASGGACTTNVGNVPMIFTGDTCEVTVPLSLIDNTDGHLDVLIKAWPVIQGVSLVNNMDTLPDLTMPPGGI